MIRVPKWLQCLLAGLITFAAAGQDSIVTLLRRPDGGTLSVNPSGLSGDGRVAIGTYTGSDGVPRGFRWTVADGAADLGQIDDGGPAQQAGTYPWAISSDGSVITGWGRMRTGPSLFFTDQPFRWSAATGITHLGWSCCPDQNYGPAYGAAISADGQSIYGTAPFGLSSFNPRFSVARWRGGAAPAQVLTSSATGAQFAAYAHAVRVSADNSTLLATLMTEFPFGPLELYWARGGDVRRIEPPVAARTIQPIGISANGEIVFGVYKTGFASSPVHFFRWSLADGFETLASTTLAWQSQEYWPGAVSADGQLMASQWSENPPGPDGSAMVWTRDRGFRSLRAFVLADGITVDQLPPTWIPGRVLGMSADGLQMVGDGFAFTGTEFGNAWYLNRCPDWDGDGLCDHWEGPAGIDVNQDGVRDLRLDQLASPDHKDIFIEVDSMVGRGPASPSLLYQQVAAAFGSVPNELVDNPDGRPGINLWIVFDETDIPDADWPNAWAGFDAVKAVRFGTAEERADANWTNIRRAKLLAYRYCIFGRSYGNSTSSGLGELPGNDFMVTLGPSWTAALGGARGPSIVAGTFMHELGHTLGLRHGGIDHINYKPNYHSVMNYTWQFQHTAYAASWRLDYSRRAFLSLNEANLSEFQGIGGDVGVQVPIGPPVMGNFRLVRERGAVDFDRDGVFELVDPMDTIVADLNDLFAADDFPPSPGELLVSQEDWSKLIYRRNASWSEGIHAGAGPDDDQLIEMNFDDFQRLSADVPSTGIGDMNCTGRVDFDDIGPFVLALVGRSSYEVEFPACDFLRADTSGNGTIDFEDIDSFVLCLVAGECS